MNLPPLRRVGRGAANNASLHADFLGHAQGDTGPIVPPSIPEPGSLAPACLTLLPLARRHRR